MLDRLRPRLTYANVMVTVLLFVVLGGGAWAVSGIPRHSVGPKQLKKNAVRGPKVLDRSLSARDINLSSLGLQRRIRWANVSEDGVITDQSGGITNLSHDPAGICTPGCDFLDFGVDLSHYAVLTTAKLQYSPGITTRAHAAVAVCGQTLSFVCDADNSNNNSTHVAQVTTDSGDIQHDEAYWIAAIPK